jgi:ribosomal protein S3
MGQKVHPLGFRVGITKKHQSQWFARFQKYGYSQSVLEDHMLRKTLLNLFSNLQTDNLQASKDKKQAKTAQTQPKITRILIERGLIPYEVGIQIHADDCLGLTAALDNLKLNKKLLSNLQKTRQYLFKAGTQLKTFDETKATLSLGGNNNVKMETDGTFSGTSKSLSLEEGVLGEKKAKFNGLSKIKKYQRKKLGLIKAKRKFTPFKKRKKLSKKTFYKYNNIKKIVKKRQNVLKRYRQLISKGLLMRKQGNLLIRKVVRKNNNNITFSNSRFTGKKASSYKGQSLKGQGASPLMGETSKYWPKKINSFTSRMYKKFASLFLTKMNKAFLVRLKGIMKYWHTQTSALQNSGTLRTSPLKGLPPFGGYKEGGLGLAPLGYSRKWYSAKSYALTNKLKANFNLKTMSALQLEKYTKYIQILERKSLMKMEALRKDFILFGTLSKTRAFGYYQLIFFLKGLKEAVNKMRKQNMRTAPLRGVTPLTGSALLGSGSFNEKMKNLMRLKSKQQKSITQKILTNYKNLTDNSGAMANECRKVMLVSYLKDLVNKHRTDNIFYYLATIADARKDLKNLKIYIKQHSNFLFGINSQINKENSNLLMQKVSKALTQSNFTNDTDNSEGVTERSLLLQKSFLNFIYNQRKMFKANLALSPKISIKFFSVKTTDFLEKASVVADSIVDALEKRQAFRGVIKKAKENLMRRSRVKGVKIQVSGRLNGAEIARSEWVRAGRVPLQTLRANIDYSYCTASTIYGIIGVKVWIFKGYSKIN